MRERIKKASQRARRLTEELIATGIPHDKADLIAHRVLTGLVKGEKGEPPID